MPQKPIRNRFVIAIPIFAVSFLLLTVVEFEALWRYFSWANQVTAAIALWVGSIYLFHKNQYYWVALIPAFFITSVVVAYIFYDSNLGLGLDLRWSQGIGVIFSLACTILLHLWKTPNHKRVL